MFYLFTKKNMEKNFRLNLLFLIFIFLSFAGAKVFVSHLFIFTFADTRCFKCFLYLHEIPLDQNFCCFHQTFPCLGCFFSSSLQRQKRKYADQNSEKFRRNFIIDCAQQRENQKSGNFMPNNLDKTIVDFQLQKLRNVKSFLDKICRLF